MSGDTQQAYLAIVRCLRDPVSHFAQCLHESFRGPGTDDERLMQLLVSHSEIDLQDISDKYYELFGRTLQAAIVDETSGDYRKLLLKIVDQGEQQTGLQRPPGYTPLLFTVLQIGYTPLLVQRPPNRLHSTFGYCFGSFQMFMLQQTGLQRPPNRLHSTFGTAASK
ncbi:hypothetical protein ACOMHN_027883 [Nucella lapillus]